MRNESILRANRVGTPWDDGEERESERAREAAGDERDMGEELELTTVDGVKVKVAFHAALEELAKALEGRTPYIGSTRMGKWLHIELRDE